MYNRYDRAYSDDGHLSKAVMKFYADYSEYSSAYSNVMSPGRIFDYDNDTAWLNNWTDRGKVAFVGKGGKPEPRVDVFERCPFRATEENIKARCVHEHLISGQEHNASSNGDGQADGKCGDNGDLTAIESRDVDPTSVCSWEHLHKDNPHGSRWCCCKGGDCFAEVRQHATNVHRATHVQAGRHARTYAGRQADTHAGRQALTFYARHLTNKRILTLTL